MREYPDDWKVKDALPVYFSKYHFENGGYDLKWFKIKFGPVYIPLPNTKGRIAAVKIHDIHHLLTEYKANIKGEVQIGAWELASGCGRYVAAWVLNFGSISLGLLMHQRTMYRAFMDGRAVRTNLYQGAIYDERLLNRTLGELRREIGIVNPKKNNAGDVLLFVLCVALNIVLSLGFV